MLIDKFLDYVSYETTSDSYSETAPSTSNQLLLAAHLMDELIRIGVQDVKLDQYGNVYAFIDGDPSMLTIGLLAHMDTSEAASGKDIKYRIIENYDGKDIELNPNLSTTVARFPFLTNYVGKTLVVTDGTTLLGADDKAGVAAIMEVAETLIKNPEIKHGPVRIAFTPDEEVGRGTENFDYDNFKVDFAYTLDGADPNEVEYENFNAASSDVTFTGVSVHPGSAKDKMINALKLAYEFNSLLDSDMVPEKTEGYEGFNHLLTLQGECLSAKAEYILRNHDLEKLEAQKKQFTDAAKLMNEKYGYNCVDVVLKDSYRNMKEKFEGHMEPIELVKKAMESLNMNYKTVAIRGGTDGAALTWHGILCPNLGTGGQNFHGVHEFWCKEDGEKMVELTLQILQMANK